MKEGAIRQVEYLSRRATWGLARVGGFALAMMMVLTFFDVIGRYFFNAPILGTVEITELLMGSIIYLGIGLTTFSRGHIRVDVAVGYLPPRVRAGFEAVTSAIGIGFSLLISWQLWLKAVDTVESNDLTQVWFLPVWPVAFTMALCSLAMPVGLFYLMVEALRGLPGGGKGS